VTPTPSFSTPNDRGFFLPWGLPRLPVGKLDCMLSSLLFIGLEGTGVAGGVGRYSKNFLEGSSKLNRYYCLVTSLSKCHLLIAPTVFSIFQLFWVLLFARFPLVFPNFLIPCFHPGNSPWPRAGLMDFHDTLRAKVPFIDFQVLGTRGANLTLQRDGWEMWWRPHGTRMVLWVPPRKVGCSFFSGTPPPPPPENPPLFYRAWHFYVFSANCFTTTFFFQLGGVPFSLGYIFFFFWVRGHCCFYFEGPLTFPLVSFCLRPLLPFDDVCQVLPKPPRGCIGSLSKELTVFLVTGLRIFPGSGQTSEGFLRNDPVPPLMKT